MDISRLEQLVAPTVEELEKEMARILETDHPYLEELALRIMDSPGKRLRPKLLVLCCKALEYEGPLATLFGTVLELIHTATLIHDDIIDDAGLRRGRTTLNRELGNTRAVLYGDLLYTKAYSAAIEAGNLDILRVITHASERMIEGELLQEKHNFDGDISEDQYFEILRRKTAYLFAASTQIAALIVDSSQEVTRALFEFGFHFGISFQLTDDCLDYLSSERELGKPVFSDLGEGKITLPIIRLLQKEPVATQKLIARYWEDQDEDARDALIKAVQEGAYLREALDEAEHHAQKAIRSLRGLPENGYTPILRNLPLHLLSRRN